VRRIELGPVVFARFGNGTTSFIVGIDFLWDGDQGGDVCVVGSVDDAGWRAFVPITRSFIKAGDGSFVGE